MKTELPTLKVFLLPQPLLHTEWWSLKGHKFSQVLDVEFVGNVAESEVIAWDGVIPPRLREVYASVLDSLVGNKVLLLIGEAPTLYRDNLFVKLAESGSLKVVELSGWNIVPEELLKALLKCREKLAHV